MAEERNVGLERAPELAADPDRTKAELQRRMEEARESITQTVTEIKDTVVNQYQQVRETISDSLDWREQYRRRPLPFSIGAFVGGALVGYVVMGALKGGGSDDYDEETDAAFGRIDAGFDKMGASTGGISPGRTYAAAPILGGAAASAYQRTSRPESNASTEAAEVFGEGQASYESVPDVGPANRPSYSSGYQSQTAPAPQGLASSSASSGADAAAAEEPKGPGIIQRFKETKAYDKLQDELSTLGERFIEELSQTARTVVVPALLGKLKDLVGVDLSGQGSQQSGSASSVNQGSRSSGTNPLNQGQSASSAPQSAQSRSATAGQGTTGTTGTTGGTEGYGAS